MTHVIYGRVMGVLTKVLYDRYNKRLEAEVKARENMKKYYDRPRV